MRFLLSFIMVVCLVSASTADNQKIKLHQIFTRSGDVFEQCEVKGISASEVHFSHKQGIATVRIDQLEPKLQQLLLSDTDSENLTASTRYDDWRAKTSLTTADLLTKFRSFARTQLPELSSDNWILSAKNIVIFFLKIVVVAFAVFTFARGYIFLFWGSVVSFFVSTALVCVVKIAYFNMLRGEILNAGTFGDHTGPWFYWSISIIHLIWVFAMVGDAVRCPNCKSYKVKLLSDKQTHTSIQSITTTSNEIVATTTDSEGRTIFNEYRPITRVSEQEVPHGEKTLKCKKCGWLWHLEY